MGFDFRYPKITEQSTQGQLTQIKSYLHQLVDQMQWAMSNLETAPSKVVISSSSSKSTTAAASPTVDSQAMFNSIKPLIIKSADIVEAYYEEINKRLVGEYVAESDFGTFKEQTIQDIEATSTDITQFYSNLQEIITDIENINFKLLDVKAHIRSGLLYNDDKGIPIYGLEIGQKNIIDGVEVFNKYAQFTSDRLSFFDQNDIEVAYISDFKIHITNAEVTGSLKLGGYIIETTNGLAFKWVGRG